MLRHYRQNNPLPSPPPPKRPRDVPASTVTVMGKTDSCSLEFLYLPFKAFCFYLQFAHVVDETYI